MSRHSVGCNCRDCYSRQAEFDRLDLAAVAMFGLWVTVAVGGYVSFINWLRSAF